MRASPVARRLAAAAQGVPSQRPLGQTSQAPAQSRSRPQPGATRRDERCRPSWACRVAGSGVAEQPAPVEALELETDPQGLQRLKRRPEGWNYWQWRGHRIQYIQAGDRSKPAVLLVHGFGASAYHWRYVVPALAKDYSVWAIDLLGFGLSDKPSVTYMGYRIWSDQLSDFLEQVVGGPAFLVGNSLGAYASLLTTAYHPGVSRGLVLVNGAGRFEEVKQTLQAETGVASDATPLDKRPAGSEEQEAGGSGSPLQRLLGPVQTLAKRAGVYIAFIAAKQPSRIRQVLRQVYVSHDNVDEDLVQSIVQPAQDSNAPDVFYRVITSRGESINALLQRVQAPVFLLWGEKDPWITPRSADKIQALFPAAERSDLPAGHCPQDDLPQLFLPPLQRWLAARL